MKIYEYKNGFHLDGERTVALGFFDGLHLGHRKLLECAIDSAKRLNIPSAVFTFRADSSLPKLSDAPLYSDAEKAELIAEFGIDELIVADFADLRDVSPNEFIRRVLIEELGAGVAISGKDFRFGKSAAGSTALLSEEMKKAGKEYVEIADVSLFSSKVSTTAIKKCLSEGRVGEACAMLGSPYFIRSSVTHGRGVGKTLGFPTINTDIGGRVTFLRSGVYKTEVEIDGARYPALTNVGSCPTFGEYPLHLETFLIDFSGDLYGRTVKIYLISFIRDERKFSSPEELVCQIERDLEIAKAKKDNP